jgi:anti-sigma regulatory factor (Ser/Thr protein kinase)
MVERRFPRDVGALPAIVGFVADFSASHGLGADPRFDVELILEELFTNLVKYAGGATSDIAIALAREGDTLTIRMRDPNPAAFDITAERPRRAEDELGPLPGGRGLQMVRAIADDLSYEHRDGVGTIIVTKRIPA